MKNFFKRLGSFLLEPLKMSGNRNNSEKLSRFFNTNKVLLYVVALFVTIIIFVCAYFL